MNKQTWQMSRATLYSITNNMGDGLTNLSVECILCGENPAPLGSISVWTKHYLWDIYSGLVSLWAVADPKEGDESCSLEGPHRVGLDTPGEVLEGCEDE